MSSPDVFRPSLADLMDLARETAIGPIPAPTVGAAMEAWQVLLTPDLAAWFLQNNDHNRRMSSSEVDHIASAIIAGRWRPNGDTIKITEAGRLADGQHRCQAVIESGIAVPTLIAFGVADTKDVMATIDTCGRTRTVRDLYEMATGKRIDNVYLAVTNLLGKLTEGVDLSDKPLQAQYLADHVDEVEPWVPWANGISQSAPLIHNPMISARTTLRSIGQVVLTVLAVHAVRRRVDTQSFQEYYESIVGDLSPTRTRTLTANQLAISQIMLKRLKNGKVLTRPSGVPDWTVLPECAVHIRSYNRWVADQKMEMARQTADRFRYLTDLPAISSSRRAGAQ